MGMVKKHGIGNICHPNALVTLKEYAVDYASEKTAANADKLIKRELENIPNPEVRERTRENIKKVEEGNRDIYI